MKTLRAAIATLALTSTAAIPSAAFVTFLFADGAYAQGNGNSNGNGNGKAGGNRRGQDVAAANRGGLRGQLASELGGLNAAHASQNALENASPNSMPGRLYIYQQAGGITAEEIGTYNAALDEVARLEALSEADKIWAYDANLNGIIDETEEDAYLADLALAEATALVFADAYSALEALAREDQLPLSAGALDELNRLLGL